MCWFSRKPKPPTISEADRLRLQAVRLQSLQIAEEPVEVSEETTRNVAAHLASLRGGARLTVVQQNPTGLHRIRLHDGQRQHGWQRATQSQAQQAADSGLPIRPEADFPLKDGEE